MVPSLDQIQAARDRLTGIALRTPLLRLDIPGAPGDIWLKLESLQPIGSFKIRGAANAMAAIPPSQLARGVLTASAGNMAQGVAWCARSRGIPCTVVAPDTAPAAKLTAIERLGARIIQAPFERWWQTFQDRSYPGVDATFIHAFDDLDVMAGNGTIGLEILEDLPDVDCVVVPWGGGGLATGIGAAMNALSPGCRIYAAEVESGAPLAAALAAGAPVDVNHRPTFVDGIGSRSVFPQMLARAQRLLAGSLVSTLDEIADAIRRLAERAHVIAEGAGACGVAAALASRAGCGRIVCVVSGGNIDADRLATILARGRPT
ncbi:MAG: pyridoxal-phosphate dependent enzyme [Pseudomonadota bacterium]|nr:pyridoxal-phosphate dependent enzyme [Pseudomonadota bacterium]